MLIRDKQGGGRSQTKAEDLGRNVQTEITDLRLMSGQDDPCKV